MRLRGGGRGLPGRGRAVTRGCQASAPAPRGTCPGPPAPSRVCSQRTPLCGECGRLNLGRSDLLLAPRDRSRVKVPRGDQLWKDMCLLNPEA